jgi:hypothetical protein
MLKQDTIVSFHVHSNVLFIYFTITLSFDLILFNLCNKSIKLCKTWEQLNNSGHFQWIIVLCCIQDVKECYVIGQTDPNYKQQRRLLVTSWSCSNVDVGLPYANQFNLKSTDNGMFATNSTTLYILWVLAKLGVKRFSALTELEWL